MATFVGMASLILGDIAWAGAPVDINLDDPASLTQLKLRSPKHFQVLSLIAAQISHRRLAEIPQWLKTDYGIDGFVDSLQWKTSDPPKKMLLLTLDQTPYVARFSVKVSPRLTNGDAALQPD